MKCVYLTLVFLVLQVNAGLIKKPPAFATPVYSDSYLPAAMQVIFHAVEQLKVIQKEESELTTTTIIPTTKIHEPGQVQPMPTLPPLSDSPSDSEKEEEKPTSLPPLSDPPSNPEKEKEKPILLEQTTPKIIENQQQSELNQAASVADTEKPIVTLETTTNEKPELGAETPEAIYGTPETNHETPETPEEANVQQFSGDKTTKVPVDKFETTTFAEKPQSESSESSESSEENKNDDDKKNKNKPSIESVVQEIYGIVNSKNKSNESSSSSSEESKEEKEKKESKESKESREVEDENDESKEDEVYDENRFNLLGEKVSQVPRPSLSAYLRKANVTEKCSLHQLALLYDALSKDARKQGFAKFSGYSDEVLKTLASSAEGGLGPQLQKILEKTIEKNNYSREDAKAKTRLTLNELKNPGSSVNKDLRQLIPLKFNP